VKKFRFLILLMVLAFGAGSIYAHKTALAGSQLEITEIKNAGVSAARETHTIIQVSWVTRGAPEVRTSSFELALEVTYADGYTSKFPATAAGSARSARFEVPTQHRGGNQPFAEMKSFKVSITANYSETATKQMSI
jgi:hypothetical protein